MHCILSCSQSCQRLHVSYTHRCRKLCDEKCEPCLKPVSEIGLLCEHVQNDIFCFQSLKSGKITCSIDVEKIMPRCGHTIPVPCILTWHPQTSAVQLFAKLCWNVAIDAAEHAVSVVVWETQRRERQNILFASRYADGRITLAVTLVCRFVIMEQSLAFAGFLVRYGPSTIRSR